MPVQRGSGARVTEVWSAVTSRSATCPGPSPVTVTSTRPPAPRTGEAVATTTRSTLSGGAAVGPGSSTGWLGGGCVGWPDGGWPEGGWPDGGWVDGPPGGCWPGEGLAGWSGAG